MLNVWEKSKIVLYFEDEEGEKYVGHTINGVIEDPADENIEKVANALNGLSDLPLAHAVLSQDQRYVF